MTIAEESRAQLTARKGVFTGTKKDEYAESTGAKETFKLGAGDDRVYFDAAAGFGTDTVVLAKNEKLDLDIKNAKDISYEVKGKDVVVTTKSDVSYVLEAKATGTIFEAYEGNVPGTHGAEFDNETVTFSIGKYSLNGVPAEFIKPEQAELLEKCVWQSDFRFADKNYSAPNEDGTYPEHKYGTLYITIDNGAITSGTSKFPDADVSPTVTFSEFKIYKVVNGDTENRIDITDEYKAAIADATDNSYNAELYKSQGEKTSSILLKDYASKNLGGELTINGKNVFIGEDGYVFDASYDKKKATYTGTVLNDQATSTDAKETFKLGAGYNTINFDAKTGFGKDTVNLTKGETLNLDIKNATDVSYKIDGKNVVVTSNSVSYVLEAVADGTITSYYKGEGTVPETAHSATFSNEKVTFTLARYGLSDDILANDDYHSEEQDSLVGKFLWQSDFRYADEHFGEGGDGATYGLQPVNLDNSDCFNGGVTFDGVTYSDVKIYKVVNGEKIEITEEYKEAIKDATTYDYSYNEGLYKSQVEKTSTITLKDLASKDLGATVNVVNGDDVATLNDYVFDVVYNANKTSFTGTWLSENIDVSAFEQTKKGSTKGVTVNAGAGNNEITDSRFDDTIKAGAGDDVINLTAGKDKITAGAGKNIVNVDIHEAFGEKTFNLTKGENLTVNLDSSKGVPAGFNYQTSTDGKNYILTFTGTGENGETVKLGSLKFANYAAKDVLGKDGSITIVSGGLTYELSNDKLVLDTGSGTLENTTEALIIDTVKKNKLTGTALSDFLNAQDATKAVTISAGAGNDTIYGSKYNDKITGGAGVNTLVLDATKTLGTDTYTLTKGETLQLGLVNCEFKDLTFTKSGNNLTVTLPGKAGAVTLKNYFKTAATVTVGDYANTPNAIFKYVTSYENAVDLATQISEGNVELHINAADKGGALSDSAYNDIITGSAKADKITVTAGHDEITAGAGNDTITIKGGSQEVVIGAKDGNDTIVGVAKSTRLDLDITGGLTANNKATALSYERKGDNLVITRVADINGTKTANKKVTTVYIDADGQLTTSKTNTKVTTALYYLYDEDKYTTEAPAEGLVEGDDYDNLSSAKWYLEDGEFTNEQYKYSSSYSTTTVKDYFKNPNENLYINGTNIDKLDVKVAGQRVNYSGSINYDYEGTAKDDTVTFGAGNDSVVETAGKNTINLGEGDNYFYIENATESRDVAKATVKAGASTVTTGAGDDYFEFGEGKYTANIESGAGEDTFDFAGGWFYDNKGADGVIYEGNKVTISDFSSDDTIVVSEYQAGFMKNFAENPFNESAPSFNIYYNVKSTENGYVADFSNVTMSLDSTETFAKNGNFGNFKTGINLISGDASQNVFSGNFEDEEGNTITFDTSKLSAITAQVAKWLDENHFESVEEALKDGNTEVLGCFQEYKEPVTPPSEDEGYNVIDVTTTVASEDPVQINGTEGNDKYNFSLVEGSSVEVYDEAGDDVYNFTSFDGDVLITDNYGNDTLNIGAADSNINLYFQVNYMNEFGEVDYNEDGTINGEFSEEMQVLVKDAKGSITIASVFGDYVEKRDEDGNLVIDEDGEQIWTPGTVKTIKTSDNVSYELTDTKVTEIANAVATWLSGTDYTSSNAVMESNNADDITAMLAIYKDPQSAYTPSGAGTEV